MLAGLNTDNLRDWRGAATIIPGQLKLEFSTKFFAPVSTWCNIPVPKIWRAGCRGAQRFSEVEGGLNQMTIRRFRRIVESSGFKLDRLETIPIRPARFLHNRITEEFLTSVVRCRLSLPVSVEQARDPRMVA
jgi:hypothetical protein